MRTQDQIVERMKSRSTMDMLGFGTGEYLVFLDFQHAQQFLKAEATEDQWRPLCKTPNSETVLAVMRDYMPFAWEKANNCRGISACRSLAHYLAWAWLLDDDAWFQEIDSQCEHYEYYGKDVLVAICEKIGLDPTQWDDKVRSNSEY